MDLSFFGVANGSSADAARLAVGKRRAGECTAFFRVLSLVLSACALNEHIYVCVLREPALSRPAVCCGPPANCVLRALQLRSHVAPAATVLPLCAVTYIAFLSFVFLVASIDADDWVTGGLEFDIPTSVSSPRVQAVAEEFSLPTSTPNNLRVTITPTFHMGLLRFTRDGTTFARWSGASIEEYRSNYIKDRLDDINAGTKQNTSFWYGLNPIDVGVFNSTIGLLAFASFLQAVVYLAMVAIQYEAPQIGSHKYTLMTVQYGTPVIAFFTVVAVIVFGASPVRKEFCTAFDPDSDFNGTFCSYGAGFDLGITSVIFCIFQAVLVWFWMPRDLGARYEFSSKGGYDNISTTTTAAASTPMASSYQDITSTA